MNKDERKQLDCYVRDYDIRTLAAMLIEIEAHNEKLHAEVCRLKACLKKLGVPVVPIR